MDSLTGANALGGTQYFLYDVRGSALRQWGSADYPVRYEYNNHNELIEMRTHRSIPGTWHTFTLPQPLPAGDLTTSLRHPATGRDTQELDSANMGPTYTHTPAGRLATRTWARGITTTHIHDNAGRLASRSHDDGTTPAVAYTRNRLGQPTQITDAAGVRHLEYDADGLLHREHHSAGLLAGTEIEIQRDALHRLSQLTHRAGAFSHTTTHGCDSAGRLATVGAGNAQVQYGYLADSGLVQSRTISANGTPVLTETRQHDRLTTSAPPPAAASPTNTTPATSASGSPSPTAAAGTTSTTRRASSSAGGSATRPATPSGASNSSTPTTTSATAPRSGRAGSGASPCAAPPGAPTRSTSW